MKNPIRIVVLAVALAVSLSACAGTSYVAPGRGADLRRVVPSASDDASIEEALARKPAAGWPATIATVRVQGAGYRSSSWQPQSKGGQWTVVGVREIEEPEHLARLKALPEVRDVAVATPLIFPEQISSDAELRAAAARVQADLLLVYTVDTAVHDEDASPLFTLLTLGLAPTRVRSITSTAQCVLVDVRSGFFYGSAEATERFQRTESQLLDTSGVDKKRIEVERKAFTGLVGAFEHTWPSIVVRHATMPAATPAALVVPPTAGPLKGP